MAFDPESTTPLILTPTRRLAHQLRVSHDARSESQGLRAWRTLDVLPWQTWVERQFRLERETRGTFGRLVTPETAVLIWRRLIEHDQVEAGVLSPPGLARAAYRSSRRRSAAKGSGRGRASTCW